MNDSTMLSNTNSTLTDLPYKVYAYLYRAINKNVFVNCDKEVKSTGNYV